MFDSRQRFHKEVSQVHLGVDIVKVDGSVILLLAVDMVVFNIDELGLSFRNS